MVEPNPGFLIKIENHQPLDVLDLTASLAAIAEEYRRYTTDGTARLYVERISEGSIIAYLTAIAKGTIAAGSPLLPIAIDTIAPFMGHWSGLLTALANYGRDAAKDAELRNADKASLRHVRSFIKPALNGNSMIVQGDVHIANVNINIGPQEAGAIDLTARHLLAKPLPSENRFQSEPMQLYQVRDAKAGDMGFIDSFGDRPRRLTFADESVKREIVHASAPFDVFFFVSGIAKTAGGEIAAYHIEKIDGVAPKKVA
jgi:hypothetical protein